MKIFMRMIPIFLILSGLQAYGLRNKIGEKVAKSLKTELRSINNKLVAEGINNHRNKKAHYYNYGKSALYLAGFKMRIRPSVTIQLPGIASLRIRPRFAFIWKRKPPVGWQDYKPMN